MEICLYPDEILAREADEVTAFGGVLKDLVRRMYATLTHRGGIGLAAPQVGESRRVIVLCVPPEEKGGKDTVETLVNPKIVDARGEQRMEEGCLSLPIRGIKGYVTRPERISVEYQDVDGVKKGITATGLLSQAIQHEVDHLNGVLFIDKIGPVKKGMILKHLNLLEGKQPKMKKRKPRRKRRKRK
jgi:peptide deformylase